MQKKLLIAVIIVFMLILLVPIPKHLKDGGTVKYKALIYEITKIHRLNNNSQNEYDDGVIIKIFGKQIYNSLPKNTEKMDENKEIKKNYSKIVDNIILEMHIPNEWQYEELSQDENNDFYKYALKLYKSQDSKNAILYFYNNGFGVCGTGRTTKEIILNNGKKVAVGYYHNAEWSDIFFDGVNIDIALIYNGLEGDEAEEVLDFVKTINIKQINHNL